MDLNFLNKNNNSTTEAQDTGQDTSSPKGPLCNFCLGSGLLGDPSGKNSVCQACQGTGSQVVAAKAETGDFAPGTLLLRQDGAFRVQADGSLQAETGGNQ